MLKDIKDSFALADTAKSELIKNTLTTTVDTFVETNPLAATNHLSRSNEGSKAKINEDLQKRNDWKGSRMFVKTPSGRTFTLSDVASTDRV